MPTQLAETAKGFKKERAPVGRPGPPERRSSSGANLCWLLARRGTAHTPALSNVLGLMLPGDRAGEQALRSGRLLMSPVPFVLWAAELPASFLSPPPSSCCSGQAKPQLSHMAPASLTEKDLFRWNIFPSDPSGEQRHSRKMESDWLFFHFVLFVKVPE